MKPIHRAICSNARTVLWESTLKRKSWHSLVATVVLLLSVGCSAPIESVPVGDEEVGPEASETTTQVPPEPTGASQGDGSVSSDLTFTVMEYRLYCALIDTPRSISEGEALRSIGKQYGIPPEEVRRAAAKVQETLVRNGWFGTPESEIRHASDWQREQP
jgi:hypothetical protein